jgi:hypothetical protein
MKRLLRILSIAGLCIASATQAMAAPYVSRTITTGTGYSFKVWEDPSALVAGKCPGGNIQNAPLAIHFNGDEGILNYPNPDLELVQTQQVDLIRRLGKICVRFLAIDGVNEYLYGVNIWNSPTPERRLAFGAQNIHDGIQQLLNAYKDTSNAYPYYVYIGSSAGALFGAKLIDQFLPPDPVFEKMVRAIWLAGPAGANLYEVCQHSAVGSLVRTIYPSDFNVRCDWTTLPRHPEHLSTPLNLVNLVYPFTTGINLYPNGLNFNNFLNSNRKIVIAIGSQDNIYGPVNQGYYNGPQYVDSFLNAVGIKGRCPTNPTSNLGSDLCAEYVSGADHGAWNPPEVIPGVCQMIAFDRFPTMSLADRANLCQ